MEDCLFCKISRSEIPAKFVYEDDKVLAFDDINPVAPVHVIIIPREHISTLNDLQPEQKNLMGHLILVMKEIARLKNLQDYRILVNCGTGAGQVVFHLHFHLLGGKRFE